MKRALLACMLLCGCTTGHHGAAPKVAAEDAPLLGASQQSDLYLGVVDGLIRQQRYQAAIAFLAKYQQAGKPTPRFRILAGQALAGAGRYDEAIASFRGALQSDRAAPAYDGIGKAQSARGAWGEAAESFRAAAQLDPANADYLNNLGFALLKQSVPDRAAAADALERAHELQPESPRIRNNLALADAMAGRRAQLHTLLDTIADPAGRKLVTDFVAAGNPGGTQP
jgi:Flp pilus assembly protein TadD